MYLLDTNIISELRRSKPHGAVLAWLQGVNDKDLYFSAVTIGEIQAGIELTREQDGEKAAQIELWLDQVADTFYEDAMIAATARIHQLAVVTHNIIDFRSFGLKIFNPFDGVSF